MNLINKKLLAQKILSFEFPEGLDLQNSKKLIEGWQKALKDSDLEKTKEKSVQGKFLQTFFESILGYTDLTTGSDKWSLIQHPRIDNDAMEPDGSLGIFTKDTKLTKAVIELKDARTSLDKKQISRAERLTPVEQAYLYATKYEGCNWILVSNFKEIRLYNKNRTQDYFERFDVLSLLNESEFKKLYYLLSKNNLIADGQASVTDNLVKDTTAAELDITKRFYSEYKEVRLSLLRHLIQKNPSIDSETLLEKTQKLLDRLTFTLVCEDSRSLLPLNIIKETYERALKSFSSSDQRVWDEFKGLFEAIDKGNSKVKPPINGYNGGLFKKDDLLDQLVITDEIWADLISLSNYDFDTDLNVNILGHIFEQSISDLEGLKSELKGETQPKKSLKRKVEGIFYTPEYITKYIVEKAVGRYLEESPEKLESIKILDPSCGSGAFLNQAHSFLLNEYKLRHEERLSQMGEKQLSFEDVNIAETNKSILLNNLFGVDLNSESVEITKLALWLKTARPSEPLQNLDKNIQNGNSLIADRSVAGELAFNWLEKFPSVLPEGFDIIIGNPPYVRNELITPEHKKYLEDNYDVFTGKSDLYVFFFEKFIQLLKVGGIGGMVVSSKYTKTKYGKKLIELLLKNVEILEFIDLKDSDVFEGITAYPSIIIFKKVANLDIAEKAQVIVVNSSVKTEADFLEAVGIGKREVEQSLVFDQLGSWSGTNSEEVNGILSKVMHSFPSLEKVGIRPQVGIKTGLNSAYIIKSQESKSGISELADYIIGKDIKRYSTIKTTNQIIFPYVEDSSGHLKLKPEDELNNAILEHLSLHREDLESRAIIREGLIKGTKKWYEYQQIKTNFDYRKYLIYPDISKGVNFTLAESIPYDMTCFGIEDEGEELLSILNSKLVNLILEKICVKARGGYLRLKSQYINLLPIPKNYKEVGTKNLVTELMQVNSLRSEELKQCLELLATFGYSPKLNDDQFISLGFNQLIDMFSEHKINLNIGQKEELQPWLKEKQSSLAVQQRKVEKLEYEINRKVYQLYGLTEEEINILEQ